VDNRSGGLYYSIIQLARGCDLAWQVRWSRFYPHRDREPNVSFDKGNFVAKLYFGAAKGGIVLRPDNIAPRHPQGPPKDRRTARTTILLLYTTSNSRRHDPGPLQAAPDQGHVFGDLKGYKVVES